MCRQTQNKYSLRCMHKRKHDYLPTTHNCVCKNGKRMANEWNSQLESVYRSDSKTWFFTLRWMLPIAPCAQSLTMCCPIRSNFHFWAEKKCTVFGREQYQYIAFCLQRNWESRESTLIFFNEKRIFLHKKVISSNFPFSYVNKNHWTKQIASHWLNTHTV